MLAASAGNIQIWLTKVFPSLFPFVAACSILLQLGSAERLSIFFRPLTKFLFRLDGTAAFPFFLGLLSGYPMGAKITARLYEEKRISLAEAQHILIFSNAPGPLFLIGTIGIGFFGMPFVGYLLLLSSILSSLLTGSLWRFHKKDTSFVYPPQSRCSKHPTLTEILSTAVADGVNTLLLIGGYLILFGALSEAMAQTSFFFLLAKGLFFLPISADALLGFCSGLLEMTNGAYLLSLAPKALRLRLSAVSFLVSFGGLSILGQTFSILSTVPIQKKDYLKGKFLSALFSSLFCYFLYPFFVQKAQKAVPVFSVFTETAFTLSFLWLFPSLFFLGVLCRAITHRK